MEKPDLDPSPIITALERFGAPSPKEEVHGSRSWVGWIIAALAALVAAVVGSWVLFRHRRELARLRHEKNKRLILAKQAATEEAATRLAGEAAAVRRMSDAIERQIQTIRSERERIEAKYEADRAALSRITSFDQFRFR